MVTSSCTHFQLVTLFVERKNLDETPRRSLQFQRKCYRQKLVYHISEIDIIADSNPPISCYHSCVRFFEAKIEFEREIFYCGFNDQINKLRRFFKRAVSTIPQGRSALNQVRKATSTLPMESKQACKFDKHFLESEKCQTL